MSSSVVDVRSSARRTPAILLTAVLLLAGAPPASAQAPGANRFSAELAERTPVADALAWLEANFERQVEEWIRITQIPAPSRQEAERAAYLSAQLLAEGLDVQVDSIGNVVAVRRGTGGGPTLVLAPHLDTVHPPGTDVTVRRDGSVLRAPGVFDNSASVANLLAVVRALNRADIRTRGDLVLLGTVQEELGLRGMEYWLASNPGVPDMVIAMDGGLGPVSYGALGIRWTRYSFHGDGAHTNVSAGRPHPALALADAIRSIYELRVPQGRGGAVYNVGMLRGGEIFNALPEEVSFTIDLRSVNPALLDSLDAEIEGRVARAAAAQGVEWGKHVEMSMPAAGTAEMLSDRRRHPLVETALAVHRYLGVPTRAVASGSTDSNAAVARGIPSISVGRGFGGDQHTLREWADIPSTLTATKLVLLLAVSLAELH